MMQRTHRLLAGTAGVLALAAATLAVAAPGDSAPPPPGPHHMAAERAEAHLARLKAELKITPAQEAAWQAFTGKMDEQAKAAQARHEQFLKSAPVVTTPDRMAQHVEHMKQHLADMQTMQAALQSLYGQLSTEQRNILDHLGPMGLHGGGMHPGMMHDPGMGGPGPQG